jgi:diguanylate cyclase (GGDEF)-like protein/PAS domain S-box-containing protein
MLNDAFFVRELNEAQRIAQMGSWSLDLVTGELMWSAEVFRLFELDPSQFAATYDAFLNAIHPDDRAAVNDAYKNSLVTRTPYEIIHRLKMSDGRIKWVCEKCMSQFDPAGKALRSQGTIQDVTQQKLSEIALVESEQKFSTAFDSCPVAASIANATDGRFIEINVNFERDFGWPRSALIGKTSVEVGIWPDPASRLKFLEAIQQTGRLVNYETVWMNIKGEGRHVSLSGALSELNGQPCILAFATDISDRKRAEDDLRIAAVAFESSEAMMVTDAANVILRVNQAFTTITGYTVEEAVGQTPRLLRSSRHKTDFYVSMWESIKSTGTWQGEVWDRRKDGSEYLKWLTISAVKDSHGRVTHYIGTHHDITDRKQAEARINELAFYDPLTNLPNRTLLQDRLKQAIAVSGRSSTYGALLLIDLDNFKTLNDTLGHEVGDLLLKHVAERIVKCIREGDTVARLGGDEFVVILANLGKHSGEAATATEAVAEKILATLKQAYLFGNSLHHSSASIGATLFNGPLISFDGLMKQADLAMYKAKDTGRNKVHFFDPVMEVAVQERSALESDLRHALEEGQFILHYQAQVTDEGVVTGAEVLLRWQHHKRGMVSPAEFIPLAEETGLILPLGNWVLETACRQLAQWSTQPALTGLTLAVNVSAHQFRQPNFVNQVLAIVENTGADPQRLKLELTESLLVHNIDEVIEKMFSLKAKGVGFSLDDFGTGYSSLSYLKKLPLDQLKIDQSFVRDVLIDPNDAAIAKTIVALAQTLGLGVIAEGVETAAQRDFLVRAGCHAYQGYFFSRPILVADFEAFAQRA